jgi:transglutaminase-like putative cysteine protease
VDASTCPGPSSATRLARSALLCLVLATAPLGARPAAPPAMVPEVIAQVDRGQFRQAQAGIDQALADATLDAATRQALLDQRERMRRIRLDFSLDRAAAFARVQQAIPDLRQDEFDAWDAQGLIEHMDIDGQRWWFKRAPSNLFLLSSQAVARRAQPRAPSDGPNERLNDHHREVLREAKASGRTSVAPRRIEVTQSLTVKADAVPDGETIRAWIPYPRAIPGQQEDIVFLDSTPAGARVAGTEAPQRTAYLEATARKGQPTRFAVHYAVTVYARHFAIDPAKVVATPSDPALKPFLAERPPHVVFTPQLRAFSRQVVGDETNPYRIARKLFAAVDRIPWAGAREYSTISNISDYALHAGHADCGQQTLLLIALLRMNGIPARWQSGWVFSDDAVGYDNIHDWGWLYLAPYGWVPMDVTTGALDSADPAERDFYFGGLDAYRMAFNDDWSVGFAQPKATWRSDDVDSQRGEAEWRGGNLYYDQWNYDFKWHVAPLTRAP